LLGAVVLALAGRTGSLHPATIGTTKPQTAEPPSISLHDPVNQRDFHQLQSEVRRIRLGCMSQQSLADRFQRRPMLLTTMSMIVPTKQNQPPISRGIDTMNVGISLTP